VLKISLNTYKKCVQPGDESLVLKRHTFVSIFANTNLDPRRYGLAITLPSDVSPFGGYQKSDFQFLCGQYFLYRRSFLTARHITCSILEIRPSEKAKDGSSEPPSPGRNGERDFHGEKRTNETHASTTDPEAKLYRKGKGKEAKLSFLGNAMTENHHGLVVETELGEASGTIEREAAKTMVARYSPGARRITLGGDKGYDAREFIDDLRALNVTPHVAQNIANRASAIDGRTTRHPGYAISQKKRKLVEEPFGWAKTIGGLARPMLRGIQRLGFKFTLTMAAYDLIRLPKLIGAAA